MDNVVMNYDISRDNATALYIALLLNMIKHTSFINYYSTYIKYTHRYAEHRC